MNGKTEAHEVFKSPSGKTIYKVTFSKGNLDPKNRVPARFTTDSIVIQSVIESSPKFGKSILLEKTYGDAPEVPAAAVPASAPAKKMKVKTAAPAAKERVMEDVRSIADAVAVLISEGVAASSYDSTVEGVSRAAKTMGISFPNLKD